MKPIIKLTLLLIAALAFLPSCNNGMYIDDGSFARVAEFSTFEQANDFIKAHRIKNVKTLDAISGDRVYLIIPSKKEIRLDLANAVLDDNYNICEGERLSMGETGTPIMFSYTAPEIMPLIVVTAVDELGHHILWAPQYSGEDGSLITTDEFKLFLDDNKNKNEESSGNDTEATSMDNSLVKDAQWVEIPDIQLPQIDTSLIHSEFITNINKEIKENYEGFFTTEWNNYQANKELGGHGPSASYRTCLNDTILSIVIEAYEGGFGPAAPIYLVYNINTVDGERLYDWKLKEKSGLTDRDIVNAFKIINSKRAGFKDGKVAYSNFDAGTINASQLYAFPMYLDDNNSLIVLAEVEGLPFGGSTFTFPIPIQEVLSTISVDVLRDDPAGTYAISDEYGSKFLVTYNNLEFNNSFCYAIYESQLFNIEYVGESEGNEAKNNGRDAYHNFDNIKGFLFKNNDGQLLKNPDSYDAIWSPIFLCNEAFIKENKVVNFKKLQGANRSVDEGFIRTFETHYNRKVVKVEASFMFGEDNECSLYSVQFETIGNEALGAYVIFTPNSISYLDFPVTIEEGGEYSVWRVDDGGDFNLENLPSIVLKNNDGYTLMMVDHGPEGYYCYDITLKGGEVRKGDSYYSGYQAPM